jgi:hypothetical protein
MILQNIIDKETRESVEGVSDEAIELALQILAQVEDPSFTTSEKGQNLLHSRFVIPVLSELASSLENKASAPGPTSQTEERVHEDAAPVSVKMNHQAPLLVELSSHSLSFQSLLLRLMSHRACRALRLVKIQFIPSLLHTIWTLGHFPKADPVRSRSESVRVKTQSSKPLSLFPHVFPCAYSCPICQSSSFLITHSNVFNRRVSFLICQLYVCFSQSIDTFR